ncbi:Major capsid protein Gp5 [uncultured Caudovirales phage]|uniref:Major capsid protein Gp5 n=1 Tax=uncultured Caudovirales phage TaxID=2100421 RepID=A0A6J5SYK7_9CAUD|nr:Major capsid protein Gp5 [uncultured Caudovirales phage]CAB4172770.1 Major capsid protein Gp5 [uncultured Caudovirales phage]CAB4178664.1 Major capsid protein Gp5 [uncultured Caudovirales phage]CAB4219487.1 Major capsid protein Gp5 [uncultured Caudovirales phage]
MANTLLTISKITNEALMVLENELTFSSQVDRNYDDQFAVVGAKIGATVNVRRPGRFIGTTGPALNVEDLNETSVPVTLSTQFHVDTQFTTQDLALSLDMFSDRILKPAVAAIANKIDFDGTTTAALQTANIVGTAGTPPTGLITYLQAQAYLDSEGAPRDGRRACIVEPFTSATIVDSLKGLFNPTATIAAQYTKGLMGRDSSGMDWKLDQNIVSQTFGNFSTNTVTASVATTTATGFLTSGWASTSTITLTAANTGTINLNAGDTFTIAGVYATNPQNRQPYGTNKLRSFVVKSAVTVASGSSVSVTVSPAVISGGQFQNVSIPTTSATAAVAFFASQYNASGNGVVSPQNIVMHRNAFTLAMADLELPEGVHFAGRASDKEIGLSMRVVRQYTINNDSIPTRVDVLYGWAPLYQELACRVAA